MAKETALAKLAAQSRGVRYGCHIDLGPGEDPDGCVIDMDARTDCTRGKRHKTREGCPYWRPIDATK